MLAALAVSMAQLLLLLSSTEATVASMAQPKTMATTITTAAAAATPVTPEEGEDYSHFAELLATVMVSREGGIDEAMGAVPVLHDMAHATIVALTSLAEAEAAEESDRRRGGGGGGSVGSSGIGSNGGAPSSSAAFDVDSWPGLSASQASKLASRYYAADAGASSSALSSFSPSSASASPVAASAPSAFSPLLADVENTNEHKTNLLQSVAESVKTGNKSIDPLYLAGERLGARINSTLERKASAAAPSLAPSSTVKSLPATLERAAAQKLKDLGDALRAREDESRADAATRAAEDAFVDELNSKLSAFDVELSKNKAAASVQEPARYANAAAAIQRAITGTTLSIKGVNFAPCLISASIRGANVGVTGVVSFFFFFSISSPRGSKGSWGVGNDRRTIKNTKQKTEHRRQRPRRLGDAGVRVGARREFEPDPPLSPECRSFGAGDYVVAPVRFRRERSEGGRGGLGENGRKREREKRKLEKGTGKKMARSPRRLYSRFFFIARRRSSASLSLSLSLDSNSRCAHDAALLCSVAFCLSLSHRFVFFLCSFSLRFPSLSSSSAPLPVTLPPRQRTE